MNNGAFLAGRWRVRWHWHSQSNQAAGRTLEQRSCGGSYIVKADRRRHTEVRLAGLWHGHGRWVRTNDLHTGVHWRSRAEARHPQLCAGRYCVDGL